MITYKLRFLSLALAVKVFESPAHLEQAIKAGDVRLQGRFAPVDAIRPLGPPTDISLDTIHNSTIHFEESRIELNTDYVEDDTGAHSIFASYVEVQVYVEDLERLRGGTQSLKKGPHYTYDWDSITPYARTIAKSWIGSLNGFAVAVASWIEDQRPDRRSPDISTVKRRLGAIFKEEQAGRKGGA